MRDIVTTIQREQDEAIRAPAAGVTLIEGGPGTGKTAVALHRAAHLLYRDRRRFEGGGVLLVGPSPVFMSYVERVLPSLGEDTAELRAARRDGRRPRGRTGSTGPRWPRSRARRGCAGSSSRSSGRRRRARRRSSGSCTGGRWSGCGRTRCARIRRELHGRIQHPNAAGAEVRRALVQGLWSDRPERAPWRIGTFADEVADTRPVRGVRAGVVAGAEPGRRAGLARRPGPGPPRRPGLAVPRAGRGAGRVVEARPVGGRHRARGRAAGAAG